MPSEPWRYRCPEGHVDVRRRQQFGDGGGIHGGPSAESRFYCETCQKYGDDPRYDHVVDMKTGMEVTT